jgi:hypothetical protein
VALERRDGVLNVRRSVRRVQVCVDGSGLHDVHRDPAPPSASFMPTAPTRSESRTSPGRSTSTCPASTPPSAARLASQPALSAATPPPRAFPRTTSCCPGAPWPKPSRCWRRPPATMPPTSHIPTAPSLAARPPRGAHGLDALKQ